MVWIPAAVGLVILVSLSGSGVSASPQLPCEFYGTVTISGSPAPAGTVIDAYVNSMKQGSITVKEPGKYGNVGTFDERLIVLAGENDFTGGAPGITFKIGEKTADQTYPYTPGTSTELALSSGGGAGAGQSVPNGTTGPYVPVSQEAAIPVPTVTSAVPPAVPPAPVNQTENVAIMTAATLVPPLPQAAPNQPDSAPITVQAVSPAPSVSMNATGVPSPVPAATPQPVSPSQQNGGNNTSVTTSGPHLTPVTVAFPSGQPLAS
jgi:hypothetical protein